MSSSPPSIVASPPPIVVPASQTFDGNDGPWSSFALQIGTPAQDVSVLISTAGYQTWAVLPQGCISSDPPDCKSSRGGFFLPNQSASWERNNVTSKGIFALDLEENLGYNDNGEYGYDTVAVGWRGSGTPALDHQIVAGISTKDFYLGTFGLTPRPTNFTNFTDPRPSFIESLKGQNLIPSLSWSYSAGNQYRLDKALGSLVLGGYDASKFVPNNVSFPFNEIDLRDLTVNLNSIEFKSGSEDPKVLSNSSLPMFIDSTIPWIFLPMDVCSQFESAFGLSYNDSVQAYLVNDTLHNKLQAQNANVTFSLGNGQPNTIINITLPYAAFDLNSSYPLIDTPTRYFPLARATNSTQYTLGRTFLQEAYVTADYERRNFSVSQCSWDSNARQDIVTIDSPTSTATATGYGGPVPTQSQYHASAGAIVGIAIGCAAIAITIVLLVYLRIKKISKKKTVAVASDFDGKPELETNPPEKDPHLNKLHEADNSQYAGPELDGKDHLGYEFEGDQVHQSLSELTGSNAVRAELDSKQFCGQELSSHDSPELPGHHARYDVSARRVSRYELPAREVSALSVATSSSLSVFKALPPTPRTDRESEGK